MMNAILVAAGIQTLHYMSRNSSMERDAAIATFNDGSSPYTCMVTSMQLSAFGVNYHKACWLGIIMESACNMSVEIQSTGRLWRIGQDHKVEWERLICRGSFDSAIESRNMEKYATTLTAEGQIDPRLKGEARVITAYEIMRRQFGQACSRYPRARVQWSEMDSDALYQEGLFYSALADFFLTSPEKADMVNQDNIKDIARNWLVGSKITAEMLDNLGSPEQLAAAMGGVDLGASNSPEKDQAKAPETPAASSTPTTPVKPRSGRRGSERHSHMESARRKIAQKKW